MSDIPDETAKHWQDAESGKTEGPPRKKNVHSFKEYNSFKNHEKTKRRWSAEEDEVLTQLVNKHGTKNWQTVACAIPDRNAHQCLSRWKYILDPAINKETWSQQEELRFIRAHQIYGNKWRIMVKHFPGRTNHALKEHWRGSMKRKLDSYLALGLLEQVPDLHENLSVANTNQSDNSKDTEVSSERTKQGLTELGEDADTSVGGSSDFIYAKAIDVHSTEVSEMIVAKSQQRTGARKKLDSLSTSEEIKTDVLRETVKHRPGTESNTEGPPHKRNVHCFKGKSSSKNPETTKCRWSAEEDEMLTEMVTKYGLKNWQTIASAMPDRNAQQCRIRWTRSLDPAINKEAWSEQEELKLIRAHQTYGNQWLKMVKHFPGRTNHALKEHWRGPMKGKLNSYLASGLLEQVPDLLEDLSDPERSQSDTPKDSEGSSDRNRTSPVLTTSPIPKQKLTGQGKNVLKEVPDLQNLSVPKSRHSGFPKDSKGLSDRNLISQPTKSKSKHEVAEPYENAKSSGGECSGFISAKGLDAHSAKVSERIMAKSKQRARARRKLDFLSTPVELKKVCTDVASCERPPSKCVDTVLPMACCNLPNDVHSSETPDQCALDIHEENASDFLDLSYCDDLMIGSPTYPHDDCFI